MATCTITTIPPPPPPPVEKKIVLELSELEGKVLHAVLACVTTNGKYGDVSYKIFNCLYQAGIQRGEVERPSTYNGCLLFTD